jgi:hypothetical protein
MPALRSAETGIVVIHSPKQGAGRKQKHTAMRARRPRQSLFPFAVWSKTMVLFVSASGSFWSQKNATDC